MRYEDFTILFTRAPSGAFLSRVVTSPLGEGMAEFVPPFEVSEILQFLAALNREASSGRIMRSIAAPQPESKVSSLEELGTGLFRSLFVGEVGKLFHETQGRLTATPEVGLRIKLRLNPREPGLAMVYSLPWEYLYSEDTRAFLALSRRTSLVRYLEVPRPAPSMPLPEVLKVLVVIPNPRGVAQLDLQRELNVIQSAFRKISNSIELTVLERATPHALREALRRSPHHILHFSGHGVSAASSGGAALILEDENGDAYAFDAELLAATLIDSPSLRLILLNACDTATVSTQEIYSSIASSLVLCGIPAVVANQSPISDSAAIAFSQSFYQCLAAGDSLDEAVTDGRLAIHAACRQSGEWGTPALFSRLRQNALFSGAIRTAQAESPVTDAAYGAIASVAPEGRLGADSHSGSFEVGQGANWTSDQNSPSTHVFSEADAFSPIRESTAFVLRELEAGYQQARQQAEKWSRASLAAAGFGLLLMVAAVGFLLLGQTDAGAISAISSVVPSTISALFFSQSRVANRRMDLNLGQLGEARDFHLAAEMAATVSAEEERNRLKSVIVERILARRGPHNPAT